MSAVGESDQAGSKMKKKIVAWIFVAIIDFLLILLEFIVFSSFVLIFMLALHQGKKNGEVKTRNACTHLEI